MQFLKAHAFMLGLAAAVVVVGGVMMVMKLSFGGDIDQLMAKRATVSDELRKLKNNPVVNEKILDAETRRAQKNKAAAVAAIQEAVVWNKGDHEVLELTYKDETGQDQTMPAFPADKQKYEQFSLFYEFTSEYQKALGAMLGELKATEAPSQQEITDEQDRIARRLARQKATEERRLAAAGLAATQPSPTPAPAPTGAPPGFYGKGPPDIYSKEPAGMYGKGSMDIYGKRPPPGSGSMPPTAGGAARSMANISAEMAAEATEKGLATVRLKKAQAGHVYAGKGSFDPVFTSAVANASYQDIWQAQVNLWVTKEIVRAINETNDKVFSSLPEGKQNVLTAPVKRLVGISIEKNYCTKSESTPSAGGGGAATGMDFKMDPKMMFMKGGPPMETPTAAKVGPSSTSDLTKRGCTAEYDVIHYRFTVVMPMRRIPDLQYSLLSRNNHTILSMDIRQVDTSLTAGAAQEGYYYGADPVVEVTTNCELLLMTAWERGTYDQQEKKWSRDMPPLMPVDVLKNLSELVPNAMREEDRQRLTETPA